MHPIFFGFGLMQMTRNEVIKLDLEIQKFHQKSSGIFVLFLGATSHWVTIVVKK
jgi:hypothetical protein